MKRTYFLSAALLLCAMSVHLNAQIKVANSGNVGIALPSDTVEPQAPLSVGWRGLPKAELAIGTTSHVVSPYNDWYNIYSSLIVTSGSAQWSTAVCGVTEVTSGGDRYVGVNGTASKPNNASGGRSYGVLGVAGKATSGYNYGVCGFIQGGDWNGAGVYGDVSSYAEVGVPGRYAGFFNGQTRVNGDFYAASLNTTSDARLKTNIADVQTETLQKVQSLRPIQFTWQRVERTQVGDTATTVRYYFGEDIDYNRSHYGFIAQEVQQLFPELVHEDGDGFLSVNYVELIPLLVQAVQELSAKIESSQSNIRANTKENESKDRFVIAELYQNNPNPFSVDTKIEYRLPKSTQSACLYVYNMSGLQIAEFPIHSFGVGSVIINAGYLEAGMYLYSLIADGQVIDTKRMILTK